MTKRLGEVLEKYASNRSALGGKFDFEGLRNELALLAAHLRRLYWLTAGMIAAIFLFELGIAVFYVNQPVILSGIGTAVGITMAGGIDRMSWLARELAETTLLVLLSERLTPERLDKIVETLVETRVTRKSPRPAPVRAS